MAENGQWMEQMTRKELIWATIAGVAIEGPILGMMGFSFLSSLILLVFTSPLLILFSPLLLIAASVFVIAMAGFGVAGITGVFGLSSFVVVYRSLMKGRKMDTVQPTEMEQQHDTEVPGTVDRIEPDEALKVQQQGTTTEPVTVDRMVELFESLKEHPHDTTTADVPIITVVDESEYRPSSDYLQQNVQRQIPQEINNIRVQE
ncbi:hypothetical protein K7X08_005320 [Anisodus acutangulus]|uniref:Uncharacterized protein n=1 Tax=Anisodus acutangulus TaxID=402998 RepID=A0A9Q1LV52_9SOLA|nr:hypothetical protein K7X08_005320 [Anisodus acutangulus]